MPRLFNNSVIFNDTIFLSKQKYFNILNLFSLLVQMKL